ncbi:MAG: S8 family serine peptidase [Actinobacteria bacterium]|nr:S8 family serine peptidase [Actinomycetota bacterium]
MIARAISWGDEKKGTALTALVCIAIAMVYLPSFSSVATDGSPTVSVIVRELPGSGDAPERAVESLGGSVGTRIEIIDGFVAELPRGSLEPLIRSAGVASATPNRRIHLQSTPDGFEDGSDAGSMFNTNKAIRAHTAWSEGYTGAGVDVALIDSGVAPVDGMPASNVVNGADLSFESQAENLRYLDTYGHGTHLAGIIAGRDGSVSNERDPSDFMGVAPDSRIVNVKVAAHSGATDVSQVLAAIDWVVQHRNDNGMNIRVLNLAYGTDGEQDYRLDPLTFAAEAAWNHGIVVVVAAGNSQFGSARMNNPAYDPYVLAVGADDTKGTRGVDDDEVPTWSARGDGIRNPDVIAPGKSVASLRVGGSLIDQQHPGGRVNDRLFRGSGTSQAAAVVAGAAALLLDQRPELSPDQVKALLKDTASPLPGTDPSAQGGGLIDLKAATRSPTPAATQDWASATGLGSLEGARGSLHVTTDDGQTVEGEHDIMGAPWDAASWSAASWSGNAWNGGAWNSNEWAGGCWCAASWSGNAWEAASWSAASWSAASWSAASWSAASWSAASWSAASWSAASWSAASWSAASWSAASWSAASWS